MLDLTDQRFGLLIAVEPTAERYRKTVVIWRCRCDCGKEKLVPASLLRSRMVKSCGCLQDATRRKDITGQVRGQLTARYPTDDRRNGKTVWAWECSCGQMVYKPPSMVKAGMSTMCPGCSAALKSRQARVAAACVERDDHGRSIRQVESIRAGTVTAQNTSGVRGVCWHHRLQKWQVRVFVGGKVKHVGYYSDLEAAKLAREKAVEDLYRM